MTDPIADLLTRIRNAVTVRKATVEAPYSTMKHRLAELLLSEDWITGVEVVGAEDSAVFKNIKITLKYTPDGKPVLKHLRRLSTPGRRVYVKKEEIPIVLGNFGTAIVSTPKGLMTNRQARKEGVGGELICEVY